MSFRYDPLGLAAMIVLLLGVVMVMAGFGREGFRAARSVIMAIGGLVLMTAIFALIISRALA